MSTLPVSTVPEAPVGPGLTQGQRVIYTFTAPSKTFADINRSTSWWLPFLLTVIVGYGLFFAIQTKVGWNQVYENSLKASPKQAAKLEQLTPEQRATTTKISVISMQGGFAALPIITIISVAVIAGVLLATINFGFGGKATFWKVFAVTWYGGLPGLIKLLLGIIAIFAGLAPESFNMKNYSGTNIGYFLNPADTSPAVMSLASSLDIITIWTLFLTGMGLAIVAGTKRSSGYIAVFGWWLLVVVVGAGWMAAFG